MYEMKQKNNLFPNTHSAPPSHPPQKQKKKKKRENNNLKAKRAF